MNSKSESKITKVFFIRHGVTELTGKVLYGQTKGIDLSDEGREQAQMVAQHFENIELSAIFSSPLERAFQTAQILADSKSMEVSVREELIESNTGLWTAMSFEECYKQKEWAVVKGRPSQFKFPQGESFLEILNRMSKIVLDIVSFNQGNNVAIVGHNGPIATLITYYLGLPLDSYERINCEVGSISQVNFTHGVGEVQSVNILPVQRMV